MKRIVLCADDYGQAEAISAGILSLIEKGRLSATSCMVNTPHWAFHGKKLAPFATLADMGLHFNLTEGKALSRRYIDTHGENLMSLRKLLSKAFMRKLDQAALEAELHTQIDCFVSVLGFVPRFIDGHQHVHQFPIVRDALIKVYEERLRQHKTYVRLVNEKIGFGDVFNNFKKLIIRVTGAKELKGLLNAHRISHNQTFAGIYTFAKAEKYQQFFSHFLSQVEDGGLIMCHPGLPGISKQDGIAKARFEEYQYISSAKFLEDCQKYRIVLQPFSSIFSQTRAL